MNENALIIFLRKPEMGKVKTRLAKDIGDEAALRVYQKLVQKTFQETKGLNAHIFTFFNPEIPKEHLWINQSESMLQTGRDLGEAMSNAFKSVFDKGFKHAALIGSDCYGINKHILEKAFTNLQTRNYTIGPSEDGGYYLLGMNQFNSDFFHDIQWSTDTVFERTIAKIEKEELALLPQLNDIDNLNDLRKEPALMKLVS